MSSMMKKDLFSKQADIYLKYRPDYPKELFDFISSRCKKHDLVWDCGTGNGQAACMLANYFKQVIATDLSEKQIENAMTHDKVQYRVASVYESGIHDHSIDCVTVAQALHWFDNDAFYNEVKRVTKPGSIIAAWCYDLPRCKDAKIHEGLLHFYTDIIGKYWDSARRHVDDHYQSIYFPFNDVQRKIFSIEKHWNLTDFLGYLSMWSAVQTYQNQHNEDPVKRFAEPIFQSQWAHPNETKSFTIDITLLFAPASI